MKNLETSAPFVAIACGGTGGHLFPGIAVAEELKKCGCKIGLLISPKEIDQQAVKGARGVEIFTLPAVGLQNRNYLSFGWSFWKSLKAAKTFLHESNTIPGRANRFLTRFVDEVFVGFPETAGHLKARKTTVTGTPVRPEFSRNDATVEKCREQLGLDPALPTILVVGGSQGASGLNAMILSTLPLLTARNWQWLHLTGANDVEKVRAAYAAQKTRAVVKTFLAEMDLALRAATVAVSRAGASSLAEMAAVRLPSLLVPFPAAADNHQYFNALAFEKSGAVKLLEQKDSTPEKVAAILGELVENETARSKMQSALAQWHAPNAAEQIAGNILRVSAFAGLSEGSMPAANPQQSSAGAASPQQFSAA
jgi:UDP-N-acetylglucosamine--N-acetylmuramyl-(pentapeptide) pyrophosphoryl-undecaprenol N-acetylglucosamine transferase